eukprot:1131451-Prorocentrum_minimum.AAC.2
MTIPRDAADDRRPVEVQAVSTRGPGKTTQAPQATAAPASPAATHPSQYDPINDDDEFEYVNEDVVAALSRLTTEEDLLRLQSIIRLHPPATLLLAPTTTATTTPAADTAHRDAPAHDSTADNEDEHGEKGDGGGQCGSAYQLRKRWYLAALNLWFRCLLCRYSLQELDVHQYHQHAPMTTNEGGQHRTDDNHQPVRLPPSSWSSKAEIDAYYQINT